MKHSAFITFRWFSSRLYQIARVKVGYIDLVICIVSLFWNLLCEKFINSIFEIRRKIYFGGFNFRLKVSSQNALFKVPKSNKTTKIMFSPITGYYGLFKKWSKFMTKVWRTLFLCYVWKYVPVEWLLN